MIFTRPAGAVMMGFGNDIHEACGCGNDGVW